MQNESVCASSVSRPESTELVLPGFYFSLFPRRDASRFSFVFLAGLSMDILNKLWCEFLALGLSSPPLTVFLEFK